MTPLAVFDNSWIHFTGQYVIFESNTANFGGGMAIFGAEPAISSSPDTSLKFSNNVALVYGGAIYVSYQSTSLSFLCNIISSNLSFNNNTAKIAGNEIYIGNPNLIDRSASCLSFLLDYTTQPSSIRYIDSVSVFLGQYIPIQLPTIDSSICNISSSLRASFSSNECTLNIDSQSYKELPSGRPSVYMYVNGSGCNNSQFDLIFSCETSISALTVNINIKTCPLGFSEEFDDICQCHEDLYCSRDTGEVCIQKGMNYNIDESIVYNCISPYCNTTYQPCTIANNTDEYKLLLPQYQCIDDRSGLSCSECKDNLTIFTYQAVRCVELHESLCIPGLIIIMVVVLQIFLSVLMLLTLKLTQHVGAGGLYTLLFYVAVLCQLTFFSNQLEQYLPLYHLILFINTFLFVDSKMLGLLPICSLNVGQLSQVGLQYLGPVITILTSFLALVIFYVIPRLRKYQSFLSFQRMLALSFLVVYWKFISTSVYIMIPVTINEYTRVYLQPSLAYLTCEHIPLWLLALAVITFYILLTNLLLLSPLLAKIKKLKIIYRQINTFLHFYTISFKDRFKWYPAVYFIAFFVIIIFKFSPEFQQFVFIVLLTLQYLCRPYQYNWMNISDALLLMSLILASSLVNSNIPSFYIISILSLLYILIVGISLVLYTSGFLDLISRKVKCLSYLRTKFTMTNHEVDVVITDDSNNESFSFDEIVMIDAATTGYREPLLDPLITRNDTFDISLPQYGINS
jgi:predicted outer membrane repeat protein